MDSDICMAAWTGSVLSPGVGGRGPDKYSRMDLAD
jgi:hypothetical protein